MEEKLRRYWPITGRRVGTRPTGETWTLSGSRQSKTEPGVLRERKCNHLAMIFTNLRKYVNIYDNDTNLLWPTYSPSQGWVFQSSSYRHHLWNDCSSSQSNYMYCHDTSLQVFQWTSGNLPETCQLCLATPSFYRQIQGNISIPPQIHRWMRNHVLQIHIPCHELLIWEKWVKKHEFTLL